MKKLPLLVIFLLVSCAEGISYDCQQIGFTLVLEEDREKLIEKKTRPGNSSEEVYKTYYYPNDKIGDYVSFYSDVGPNYQGYWFKRWPPVVHSVQQETYIYIYIYIYIYLNK